MKKCKIQIDYEKETEIEVNRLNKIYDEYYN